MQPDPSVFLPAIRETVLRGDLFGAALHEGLSPILLQRAGEGLAHLALRCGELPGILRGMRAEQRSLLRKVATSLQTAGIAPTQRVIAALACSAPRGSPGEDDIRGHETLVEGISAAIASLSAATERPGFDDLELGKLHRAASLLESQMRARYKAALQRLKGQFESSSTGALAPSHVSPDDANVTAILRSHFPQFAKIEACDVRRLPGVNAQEIYFFELKHHPEWEGPTVLRRESAYNPTGACLADEFDLLNHLHRHGLAVAPVLLAERDTAQLGSPFLMMKRLAGSARLPESLGASGPPVALDMARFLSALHRLDVQRMKNAQGSDGATLAARMRSLIDRFYERWRVERTEGSLALEAAFSWLRANTGCLQGQVSLVHGDCNFRNILIDGARVSAVLDWELSHLGCAAEDLSYIRTDIEKILPWPEFMAVYTQAGGVLPSEQMLRYFAIWANVWRTSMAACIYSGYLRGSHRNFIFATVAFNEYYTTLDDLCTLMVDAT